MAGSGVLSFVYDEDYVGSSNVPLSVKAPLDPTRDFLGKYWFEGLLPDAEHVLTFWHHKTGLSHHEHCLLLGTRVGRDCPGGVTFYPYSSNNELRSQGEESIPVSEVEIGDHLSEMKHTGCEWLMASKDGFWTLAGAQSKTALRYTDNQWYVPTKGGLTTHILKPEIDNFRQRHRFLDSDIAEFITMQTALTLGLDVPATSLVDFGHHGRALVVERYDRIIDADGKVTSIHQEDLCQAMGKNRWNKYQGKDTGPTPVQIADLLWEHASDPETDIRKFLSSLIFNWLFVCPDGHSKNYSLLLAENGVRLAPFYDICSYYPYMNSDLERDKTGVAMHFPNRRMLADMDCPEAWAEASEAFRLPVDWGPQEATRMANHAQEALVTTVDALETRYRNSEYVDKMLKSADRHLHICKQRLC